MDRVNDQPTWLDRNDNFLVLQKYSLYFICDTVTVV